MDDSRFVLGVDLDGVCFDFYGSIRPYAARWMGCPVEELSETFTYGFPQWGIDAHGGYPALHQYLLEQSFFAEIAPIDGSAEALRRLSDEQIRIRIITHRLFISGAHQQAVAQTVAWLDRFEIPYWDICFMKDKAAVGADLYIEDTEANVIALRGAGNLTVVFGNVTNVGFPGVRLDNWLDVEAVVRATHERWQGTHRHDEALLALPERS